MDGRLAWVLLSISTVASLGSLGLWVWSLLAWRKTSAGKATDAIETGLRVATFRLAQMDGQLAAMSAALREEAAKTIGVSELTRLLDDGVTRSVPPTSGPEGGGVTLEAADTTPMSVTAATSRHAERSLPPPRSHRTDTMRLEPGMVQPPRVAPPAWVTMPARENEG